MEQTHNKTLDKYVIDSTELQSEEKTCAKTSQLGNNSKKKKDRGEKSQSKSKVKHIYPTSIQEQTN